MKKKRLTKVKLTKTKKLTINFGDLEKAEKLNLDYHIKNGRIIWEKDNVIIARALAVEYLLDNGEKLTTVKIGTVKEICDYFNHTDITGFEEAVGFMPMIGTIPFMGYVFSLADGADVDAFIATLETNANPRWNICTEAEQTVIKAVGNKVFFLMCPKSLEG